jgi:hypothetical protein
MNQKIIRWLGILILVLIPIRWIIGYGNYYRQVTLLNMEANAPQMYLESIKSDWISTLFWLSLGSGLIIYSFKIRSRTSPSTQGASAPE